MKIFNFIRNYLVKEAVELYLVGLLSENDFQSHPPKYFTNNQTHVVEKKKW